METLTSIHRLFQKGVRMKAILCVFSLFLVAGCGDDKPASPGNTADADATTATSDDTATATSDGLSFRIRSPAQTAFASGTACSASAQALMMKSLTLSFTPRASNCLLSWLRNFKSASSLISRRR